MNKLMQNNSYQNPRARPLTKRELVPINNLKIIFREIRDYFAGNVTGITRDETIAENMMRLLFCKILDERNKREDELVEIARRPNESARELTERVSKVFGRVKARFGDIFEANENIEIPPTDLVWIVARLEEFSLFQTDRDVMADAFEELIGRSFRGGEGQFFTPRNVVQMIIEVLEPTPDARIIDPACGSGGFLVNVLRFLLAQETGRHYLVGIDKDKFLARLAKIYLTLVGENEYHIFCENSLEEPKNWQRETCKYAELDTFDFVLTNPPFGAKIPVVGDGLLRQYELGHAWNEYNNKWHKTRALQDKQPPQILFIERCLQFLKDGGKMGIVLPEGIFGNPSERYVWEFINQYANVFGVVSLSQETFQPSTHTKTSVLFLEKTRTPRKHLFMAIANAVGHNKNGKETYRMNGNGSLLLDDKGKPILDDDLPTISKNFQTYLKPRSFATSHLGFKLSYDEIRDFIFIPEYYNPELVQQLDTLKQSGQYAMVSIGELIEQEMIEIRRGNEIGSQFYGTGTIPFVRTTDIVNWEIKIDPIKSVSEEVYEQYRVQQDVRENDILFVSDGTFLIGRSAIVTRLDTRILIQSHLKKIRVTDTEQLDPFYLLYLLNSRIVRRQIQAKTFVQATISTLGNRLYEILLPIETNQEASHKIASSMRHIIEQKMLLREQTIQLIESSPE